MLANSDGRGLMYSLDGQIRPTLEEFRELARTRRVIPVAQRLLADGETPVALYRKLAGERAGTFLLESAEHGHMWSRYSFVGVNSRAMLTEVEGRTSWVGDLPAGIPLSANPLETLRQTLEVLHTNPLPGLPPLTSGMVGLISYDAVRRWERLPIVAADELHVPEIAMLLATEVAVLDHWDGSVWLISNAINFDASDERVDDAYDKSLENLAAMREDLMKPSESHAHTFDSDARPTIEQRTSAETYLANVEICKEHIRGGDAFQIVLSQRFQTPATASSLDIYRVLRVQNPSPYMYLFRFPTVASDGTMSSDVAFDVVGSSPEALVKLSHGRAMLHPIAGTRKRGASVDEDQQLADDLLHDTKERAEHLMLVDLGRNDLGRVCASGTVEVTDFMSIERYSHVMHIVSTVEGDLSSDKSAYDLLAATFPAGTLSGAPKPRAMEIIEELEPVRRGVYGGCVGYLDFAGDMDTAIAIRTAVIKDGIGYVQAGAGIVADSDPDSENQECHNKAAAVLRAIAVANSMKSVERS
jgi:anthranilate synthase component 1